MTNAEIQRELDKIEGYMTALNDCKQGTPFFELYANASERLAELSIELEKKLSGEVSGA